jgi:acetylornithine deacetylase
MKGPTAAAMAAIAALADQPQSAPLFFFVTGDEESGMAGARLLTDNSSFYCEAVALGAVGIIGEPSELQVVNSHKGGCHFDVCSSGVAAHSSTNDGLNANWQLIPFLNYLQQLHRRCQNDPSLLNSNFSNPTLSLNVVIDNEPSAFNITVGRATCHVFFRPMPHTQWEAMLEEIKATARDMELELSSIRCLSPLLTDVERPFVRMALRLAEQTAPASACYATDGCCFDNFPDLIVLGPGSIEQAHRHDEWIEIEQLHRGTELYRKLFQQYAFS